MATTAIWDVKDRLERVLDYAANPEKTANIDFQGLRNVLDYAGQDAKTEHQFYVTGINCDPVTACEQMKQTKLRFQKTDSILAFHAYQAFTPGETVPEIAHAIGVKLAQELWGNRFEVVVSTHLDKKHLHNHFVINSVSFLDGKRYYDNKATYSIMRRTSDRFCLEHDLSVIHEPQHGQSRQYAEWLADQEGKPTWRGLIRADIDRCISASTTFTQFITSLRKQGYEVKTGVKYLAVRPPGKDRFVRLRSLGDEYTEEAIKQRILKNRAPPKRRDVLPEPKHKRGYVRGSIRSTRKLTGLRALYLHYLYKMGILPRNRAIPKRTHFLLREDIRHMDRLIAQTRLLCTQHIETRDQLVAHQTTRVKEIDSLSETRACLRNRIRQCSETEVVSEYKDKITGISKQIRALRKEVKLCADILIRSEEMRNKLHCIKQEEQTPKKEETNHEQRSRRGGPDRQHEPTRD